MNVPGFNTRGVGPLSLLRSAWKGTRKSAASDAVERSLDAIQREKLLQVMKLGCLRSTAAKYVGLNAEQLEGLLGRDEELKREVLRAEAEAEVRHMGNVHKASNDEKNWRTSVWWLEQRGVSMNNGGAPDGVVVDRDYPEAVLAALERIAELIVAEIPDVERRQSLLTKLLHISVESVESSVVIDIAAPAALALPDGGPTGGEILLPRRHDDTTGGVEI